MTLRSLLIGVVGGLGALAPASAATLVDLATPLGTMRFELFEDAKPVTVGNFLQYINSGRYADSFAHRLDPSGGPPAFVLQGGAYTWTPLDGLSGIPTFGSIVNEPGPFPAYSNLTGTLAMARVGGNVDSATSQWFLNLRDNVFLDTVDEGFTVFGQIVDGQDVLAALSAFTYATSANGTNVVVDLSGDLNADFSTTPVTSFVNNQVTPNDLIFTTWTVVPEPSVLALGAAALVLATIRSRRHLHPARCRSRRIVPC